MTNYDSFSHCHLTDIFFRYSRGSKRVNRPFSVKSTTHVKFKNNANEKRRKIILKSEEFLVIKKSILCHLEQFMMN